MQKQTAPSFSLPFDYTGLMTFLDACPILENHAGIGYMGESILGRSIPLITFGHGQKEVLYVGAHHGMESLSSVLLCKLIWELSLLSSQNGKSYGKDISEMSERYTIYIIPMLNPDGVEYALHGISRENPLYDRLIKMNGGCDDFSHWQANARGVDLNHNYNHQFDRHKAWEAENGLEEGAPGLCAGPFPESEPEVAHLCNFVRFHPRLRGILTLHTRGEQIFFRPNEKNKHRMTLLACQMSRMCGYRAETAEGTASHGGLADWCGEILGIPAFTLECGKGNNPQSQEDWPAVYIRLRELLFQFPFML